MNISDRTVLFILFLYLQLSTNYAANAREGRISGGEIAEPNSHPYTVSLQSRVMWRRYRVCGGTIVSRRWIVSAGHCVTDYTAKWLPMDAVVGAHNLQMVSYDQIYPISRRIAHPYYRGGVGPYDISMMRTSREIKYSATVKPIMLPPRGQAFMRNERFLITGWGALQASVFVIVLPNKLREAEVKFLPYYDCYKAIDHIKDYHERNPLVKEFNLCTGPLYEGVAGCTGDSGGGLIQYMIDPGAMVPPYTTESPTREPGGSSSSPMPMTTDRPPYSTMSTSTSTSSSPMPMTTDRPPYSSTGTPSYSSTYSPMPMTTDRPPYTTTSTSSPSYSTTYSPMPMTTDMPTMSNTESDETTPSPMPVNTDRSSATTSPDNMNRLTRSIKDPQNVEDSTVASTVDSSSNFDVENNTYFKSYNMGYYENGGGNNNKGMIPVLIGVISWGVVPCGYKGAPTVYTNVSKHMDFINEYIDS